MSKILTISIAAYHVEKYIEETLQSLLVKEIVGDLEIFVVDDGGDDETLKIAQKYADLYPHSVFCVHKENGGYGSTINSSIEMATGKYFKQLDGDDWFQKENMAEFIKILKEVDADCVLTYYNRFYEGTGVLVCKEAFDYLDEKIHCLRETEFKNQLSMYTVTFKTNILKNMPERITEHCFYTDAEFSSYPVLYLETVYVWHKPIYVYRIGREGQSMSPAGVKKHYREHETVFWNLVKTYKRIDENEHSKKEMLAYKLRISMIEQFKFFCILPINKENLEKIKNYENKVKQECPQILESAMKCSKFVKLLLGSHYLTYPVMKYIMKEV